MKYKDLVDAWKRFGSTVIKGRREIKSLLESIRSDGL